MSKFILLSALSTDYFGMETYEELKESLEEFGCSYLISHQPNGEVRYYAVANTKEAIERMCEAVELPGVVLEYTAIYDFTEVES